MQVHKMMGRAVIIGNVWICGAEDLVCMIVQRVAGWQHIGNPIIEPNPNESASKYLARLVSRDLIVGIRLPHAPQLPGIQSERHSSFAFSC